MFKPGCSSSAASSSSMLQTASQKDEVKYKGVRKRKWGKWVSEIRLPNSRERIWLGSYDSAEKAARAFDAALFCLRGKNAKFNFAENPPDLAGGRSLTPAEIQVVASQYANEYNHEQQMQQPREVGLINAKEDDQLQSQLMDASEDSLPISSNSDGAVQKMDTVNWSFLDLLEPNGGLPGTSSNVPDYNLMLSSLDNLHEDMYMTPQLGPKVDDSTSQHGDDQNVDENYSHQSFLWNF